jgi:hypothetical protein
MKHRLTRFLVSDKMIYVATGVGAVVATLAVILAPTIASEVLLVNLALALIAVLALRSWIRRRVLVGGVVATIWLIAFASLIVFHAPGVASIALALAGVVAAVILIALRRAEY